MQFYEQNTAIWLLQEYLVHLIRIISSRIHSQNDQFMQPCFEKWQESVFLASTRRWRFVCVSYDNSRKSFTITTQQFRLRASNERRNGDWQLLEWFKSVLFGMGWDDRIASSSSTVGAIFWWLYCQWYLWLEISTVVIMQIYTLYLWTPISYLKDVNWSDMCLKATVPVHRHSA